MTVVKFGKDYISKVCQSCRPHFDRVIAEKGYLIEY